MGDSGLSCFKETAALQPGSRLKVSVIASGEAFQSTQSGNVFVADTNHGEAPSGPGGGPVVRVEWLDPTHLRITHDKRVRVFSSATSIHGINVMLESK